MRKLFAAILLAATPAAVANETAYRSLQSGSPTGPASIHDRGIRGEGQIVAVLDTGVDWRSCYFAEADGSPPPYNFRITDTHVDLSRRKIIAYNFLYSCVEYPTRTNCDSPELSGSFDNQGHGTHAAASAVGDRAPFGIHDFADAIAPMAKLVVQDGGYGNDNCTFRPGFGCPVRMTPILAQAYAQGVRIHSNSWGDRQGTPWPLPPPTANYPQSARDIDAFVHAHPDMLVVFNTGNFGSPGTPPASSLSAPGAAKNTIQVGGTRDTSMADEVLAQFTLFGPTRDGRIKPDLVGPAYVIAGDANFGDNPNECAVSLQGGTSWASPTIAGAAALVRQYYADGFYDGRRFNPSAALVKATLIAAARPVRFREGMLTKPVPSNEQGWGFPVLDDALSFPGESRKLKVVEASLAQGESSTIRVTSRGPLKAILVWTDPAGETLVNDLDLNVNGVASSDHVNNVEGFITSNDGTYSITVHGNRIASGRQSYALVITGEMTVAASKSRAVRH